MPASTLSNLEVLFEDNHLIAVNKRSGDIIQGDHTGDTPLSDIVKDWLKSKYEKPGNVFLGTVHRIDRPVTGVVVFAKTSKALSRMTKKFKDKEVQKTYLAAVCAAPPKMEDKLISNLMKDQEKNKSKVVSKGHRHGKESILDYRMIAESERYWILEVKPQTGRHHQIRVQLASIGCSIKGDLKYGAPRPNKDGSIHLHAYAIEFEHPVTLEKIKILAPLPEDPVWSVVETSL